MLILFSPKPLDIVGQRRIYGCPSSLVVVASMDMLAVKSPYAGARDILPVVGLGANRISTAGPYDRPWNRDETRVVAGEIDKKYGHN